MAVKYCIIDDFYKKCEINSFGDIYDLTLYKQSVILQTVINKYLKGYASKYSIEL